jgi:MFS family permease
MSSGVATPRITLPPASGEYRTSGKWLVAGSVMIGTFLSVMDATVVNVAMPHMMGSFGQDLLTITWVSTAYSIAEIIMITMAAWWTMLLGRKQLFLVSMFLFIVGSVLAGTSKTFGQLIFYRVLQGIGGGSLMPCSQAIARELFRPRSREWRWPFTAWESSQPQRSVRWSAVGWSTTMAGNGSFTSTFRFVSWES